MGLESSADPEMSKSFTMRCQFRVLFCENGMGDSFDVKVSLSHEGRVAVRFATIISEY